MDDFFDILFYVVFLVTAVAISIRKAAKQKTNTTKNVSPADGAPVFPDVLSEKTNGFPVEKNIITKTNGQKLQPDHNLSSNLGHKETLQKEKVFKNAKNENNAEKEHIRRNMFKKAILYSAIITRPYD
ncbi:MAG TPA: hypothetical protein PLS84_02715 [Salinivirgaceae bacterium]|nr:hypothetical protein [Salinivirgaceae bacterium]